MAAHSEANITLDSPRVPSISTRDWEQLLSQAACEVFEMMAGFSLTCSGALSPAPGEFTAVVGVTGPIHGIFSIRCEQRTAIGIARGMLGVDDLEAKGEVWDALGEICNMVIGSFKAKTGPIGESSALSVPTVIHGHDYRLRPLINGQKLDCLMCTPDGSLHLQLEYTLTPTA